MDKDKEREWKIRSLVWDKFAAMCVDAETCQRASMLPSYCRQCGWDGRAAYEECRDVVLGVKAQVDDDSD